MKQRVVLGIVLKDKKVLMVLRNEDSGIFWAFPGGKIEKGEREKRAVCREVYEETGVICSAVQRLGERKHKDSGQVLCYWVCKYNDEVGKFNSREIKKKQWMNYQEMKDYVVSDLYLPLEEYLRDKI